MVGCKLRSSEPCGCTLTLRDRFLWLSVLVRVGAERRKICRQKGRGLIRFKLGIASLAFLTEFVFVWMAEEE